jgi:hypothetical protein
MFGNCFGLDVATMFGTVLLALMHVANALVYSFFELLINSCLEDKYRQNAPCPDLIVPFLKKRRGQSAKTLLLRLFGDSLYNADNSVSLSALGVLSNVYFSLRKPSPSCDAVK